MQRLENIIQHKYVENDMKSVREAKHWVEGEKFKFMCFF